MFKFDPAELAPQRYLPADMDVSSGRQDMDHVCVAYSLVTS